MSALTRLALATEGFRGGGVAGDVVVLSHIVASVRSQRITAQVTSLRVKCEVRPQRIVCKVIVP